MSDKLQFVVVQQAGSLCYVRRQTEGLPDTKCRDAKKPAVGLTEQQAFWFPP
jgi:hypothetical protein